MNLKKLICNILLLTYISVAATAQGLSYEKEVPLGRDLVAVMRQDRWGVKKTDGTLVLPVEYNEPHLMNGMAVIVKFNTDILEGVLKTDGTFVPLPDYSVERARPFVCDGMLAVKDAKGKWGFLNVSDGSMLGVNIKGTKKKTKSIKGTFVFDRVIPFNEGIAVVYSEKNGWRHIDTSGDERFKTDESVQLRTSVDKGKCLILTESGLGQCQEMTDNVAGVLFPIDGPVADVDFSEAFRFPYVVRLGDNRLTLDARFKAEKYERAAGDSVVFVERPKPKKPKPVEKKETFSVDKNIKVDIARTVVQANSKGRASVTVVVSNNSKIESEPLDVTLTAKGASESWSGTIAPGASRQISISFPARFAVASIKRQIDWSITGKSGTTDGSATVTVKRYNPGR